MSDEARLSWFGRGSLISSITMGAIVGIGFRLVVQAHILPTVGNSGLVMTVAFLALAPFAIGFITIHEASTRKLRRWWQWILIPWAPILVSMVLAMLLFLEGSICVIFAAPIALFFSSIGGVAAGLLHSRRPSVLLSVAMLPILLAPIESRLNPPIEQRVVANQIEIRATPQEVWRNIERVRAIGEDELRPTWAHAIGFPRPVEATLSHEGIGGVRHASFEHGLLFIETVDEWLPDQKLGFTIRADTRDIPPATLDEHVTIGGRYFDVLRGEYRIEPVDENHVILHLESRQRLSTDFNEYAGLWTDGVMSSLQQSILEVIQHRCETGR